MTESRKAYLRNYQKQWWRKRRDAFFQDKSCVKCGSLERLELDHIDPSLKTSHSIWTWSKSRQEEEIAKCQVLCHDCHWKKTKEQNGWGKPEHGKMNTYRKYACRCDACIAAAKETYRKRALDKKYRRWCLKGDSRYSTYC